MKTRFTLVIAAVAVAATSMAFAQASTPTVPRAPSAASQPVARVAPALVPAIAPIDQFAPVAPVASVAPVAVVGFLAEPDAPQAPPAAQSPTIVATTPSPRLKVVRPTVAGSPKVTLSTAGEDPQAPPPPPVPPVPPPAPRATRAPEAPTPPMAMPKVVARSRGQFVNVRLEFTITDQIGSATPVKKVVTMNVADGESGRIRTNAEVYRKTGNVNMGSTNVPLSIDASPELEGGRIRLRASLDYQLLSDSSAADLPGGKTSISQSVTSILIDGVQTILSQSADPLTDRKVTLEVKATIVK